MSVGKRWSKANLRAFVHGFPTRFSRSENIHALPTRRPAVLTSSLDYPFASVAFIGITSQAIAQINPVSSRAMAMLIFCGSKPRLLNA
jgi:hypothetical protein